MKRAFNILMQLWREIVGEVAYERYLLEKGVARSSESFKAFAEELEKTKDPFRLG